MDMVMVPERYREFFETLKRLVKDGKVPLSRIDDAVTRILRVKSDMGLLDKNRSQLADRKLWKSFGSSEHRQVARELVPVDCAPQERSQYLAALEAGGSHSRRRQECGRPWKPVRRMDDHVARRERQRYSGRDYDSRGNPECRPQEYRRYVFQGRNRSRRSIIRDCCHRRDTVCRDGGRPRRPEACGGGCSGPRQHETGGHPRGRHSALGPTDDYRGCAG